MKQSIIKQIKADISTFADDVDEVYFQGNGELIYQRFGKIVSVKLVDQENHSVGISYDNKIFDYKVFLASHLADLTTFARKIIQKDNADEKGFYVDPQASLVKVYCQKTGKALEILRSECEDEQWSGTRIAFVTADAGHGKSFLLRQFQRTQAQKYLEGNSNYLFWHIDLHGRELVRLNEAIMYELGDLRITGLYYNSIITLIRNGLIILGIDGFDELAAEKGGDVALGSLTNLVSELEGDGILVAASRRTFFNTQDYIQRTGILHQKIDTECEFDEIRLQNWSKEQCVSYIGLYYNNPEDEYIRLRSLLHSTHEHPLLERPFLFTKIVSFAYNDNLTPYEFVSNGGESDMDSINKIIATFVRREVNKWSTTEKDTGKPYLNFNQHMRLLADVANEMWLEQKDSITIDTISFMLTMLYDEWKTDATLRPMITKMSESHALLPVSSIGDRYRKFDHDEFRHYFLAMSLERILCQAVEDDNYMVVKSFLKVAQLPDAVAQYLTIQLSKDKAMAIIKCLLKMEEGDWKATYVQPNIGTLLPYLLHQLDQNEEIIIGQKITFSSLVFENKSISDVKFLDCSFINVSFNNTHFKNIVFDSCTFTEIKIHERSNNSFINVVINDNCTINTVTIVQSEEESYSEYSPYNINGLLLKQGFCREKKDEKKLEETQPVKNPDFRKLVKRFLNKYIKATYQYEKNILEDPIYNSGKSDIIIDDIIPLLLEYNIIEEASTSNTLQTNRRAWKLKRIDVSDLYKAEEDVTSPLHSFWEAVHEHE